MQEKKTIGIMVEKRIDRGFDSDNFGVIMVNVVDATDDKLQNLTSYTWTDKKTECYAHLTIRAQTSSKEENGRFYGWEIAYHDLYTVNVDHAERLLKTIKAIHRKMDKITEKLGECASFPEFVCRFAYCIGAEKVVREIEKPSNGFYTAGKYDFDDTKYLAHHVSNIMAEITAGLHPERKVA